MEPDLDRLLDFENGGSLFPQFRATWGEAFAAAAALRKSVESSSHRARVAIEASDEQSFCALFLAFCRGDFDLFLFNPRWGSAERSAALEIADPDWIVGDFRAGRFASRLLTTRRGAEESLPPGMRLMIPTGGTNGRIRFAIHRWSSLAASAYGFQQFFDSARVASHCVLPLYHVSGFMQLVRALLSMGCIVFGTLDTFVERHELLIAREPRDRFLSLVSTQLARLAADPALLPRLLQYRAIFVGGGPTPPDLLEECRRLALPLAPTYGMTETAAQIATMAPEAFLRGETGQGRALPHARIDIVSDDDRREVLSMGEEGRIRIFATSLFHGYFGESDPPAHSIVTSDLGALDEGGHLTVLGRADRAIISGGEKIDPAEVERAAARSGLTIDAVAFGIDDAEWGQRLALAYAPRDALVVEDAIRDALRRELAPHKVPKTWIRLASIPRNEAGKAMNSHLLAAAAKP